MTTTESIDELNLRAWALPETDLPAARALAVEACELARNLDAPYSAGIAYSLRTLGWCAYREADFPGALEYFSESLLLFRQCGDRSGEASILNNIGSVYHSMGEYRLALEHVEASAAITSEIGNRAGEGSCLMGLGNIHYMLGDSLRALEYFQASLEIRQSLADELGQAAALGSVANVYARLGEYPRALEYQQASMEICRRLGFREGEARLLNQMGGIELSLGDTTKALETFTAGQAIRSEIGDRMGEAGSIESIGQVHRATGDFPLALHYFRSALEIRREIGDRAGEGIALSNVGNTFAALGDHQQALEHIRAAMEICHETGELFGEAHAGLDLGLVHSTLGKHRESIATLEAALALADATGARDLIAAIHQALADEHEALGETADALAHFRRFHTLREELVNVEAQKKLQSIQVARQIEVSRQEAEIERLRNVELRQALDELKAAQSSLVQSEKMASLGQLVAGIAHEINNPINFVSASIGPLRRDHAVIRSVVEDLGGRVPAAEFEEISREADLEELFEEMEQLIGSIDNGAARTAGIVAGLRSFSRLDEGELKPVDLHEGLDAALTILSGSMSERIVLHKEYGLLPPVECYPGEINQVFMNILTNAIRAIDGKGTVTVRTTAADESVEISITDTGAGMTPEIRSRIFEPFFTTREVGQGRGLGLSIAWGIVEKHGGSIDVTSTPGAGSEFVVSLPVAVNEEG